MVHQKTMSAVVSLLLFIFLTSPILCWANTNAGDDLFPVILTDDLGIKITITKKPERIVSTAPNNTEIIFALGLEDKLVGRTDFCNYPPGVEKIESIGMLSPLNLEKIVSLEPDLILTFGGLQAKDIIRLRELGYKVLALDAETLSEMLNNIEIIATACGVPEKGKGLITNLKERIDFIATSSADIPASQRLKVFTGSSYEAIWSPGKDTLFDDLITLAGGQNIAGNQKGWVTISSEQVALAEPDVIIITSGIMNPEEIDKMKDDVIRHPGWSQIPAIKKNHIFAANEDLFYRAGPRLVEGLELLYEIFSGIKE